MGNVTISATTANACGCCGEAVPCAEPTCSVSCESEEYRLTSPACDSGQTFFGTECRSYYSVVPCTGTPGEEAETMTTTINAQLSCLNIGNTYSASFVFESTWSATEIVYVNFTATAETEYYNVPPVEDPQDPGAEPPFWDWSLVSCSITEI